MDSHTLKSCESRLLAMRERISSLEATRREGSDSGPSLVVSRSRFSREYSRLLGALPIRDIRGRQLTDSGA